VYWAGGSVDAAEVADDLAVFGIGAEQAQQIQTDAQPREFAVFEENWPVVETFLRAQTQWRVAPMGGLIGLDYTAVRWLMELHPPADPAAHLEDLQVMELAALRTLRDKEAKHGT
jgi:hypothetical protein